MGAYCSVPVPNNLWIPSKQFSEQSFIGQGLFLFFLAFLWNSAALRVRISYRLHRYHQNLSFNTSKGDALRIRPPQWTHYIYALSLGFKSKLLVYYFSLRATGLRSLSEGQFNAQTHSFSPTSMLASFFNCNATTKPHMAINLIFQYQFLGCDWDFCIWIWILDLDFAFGFLQTHGGSKTCSK